MKINELLVSNIWVWLRLPSLCQVQGQARISRLQSMWGWHQLCSSVLCRQPVCLALPGHFCSSSSLSVCSWPVGTASLMPPQNRWARKGDSHGQKSDLVLGDKTQHFFPGLLLHTQETICITPTWPQHHLFWQQAFVSPATFSFVC